MYKYQSETILEYKKLPERTVSQKSMNIGLNGYEPLIVAMDSMLRYAKAYKKTYDSQISEDGVLGEEFLDAISGIRGLLNGEGAVAMEKGITTDSKDNGAVESIFWECMKVGGFKEEDL